MMVRTILRAGAWRAVIGISGVAAVVGGCGVAFPATATALLPIAFTLLAAAEGSTTVRIVPPICHRSNPNLLVTGPVVSVGHRRSPRVASSNVIICRKSDVWIKAAEMERSRLAASDGYPDLASDIHPARSQG
jgi:hypothetical protein